MIHTISNDRLTVQINEKGAELWSIRSADGTEYLWQGDPRYWSDRALNLFPQIGLCTDDRYTVDGKTYTYSSRQDWGSPKGVGRQKTGWYDPKRPDLIREDKPRKPILGGGLFFLFAAFCLLAEILVIRDMIIWGL